MNDIQKSKMIETDIIIKLASGALEVLTSPESVDIMLAEISAKVQQFPEPDTSTATGRELIASNAYTIARTKTFIDQHGKETVAKLKEIPKKVDAARKIIRDRLDELRDEIREPLNQWEEAEENRISEINTNMADLEFYLNRQPETSMETKELLSKLPKVTEEIFQERYSEAVALRESIKAKLEETISVCEKQEAEYAELQRLRKEREEQDRQIRDQKIREEAAEQARLKEIERNNAEKERIKQQQEAAVAEAKRKQQAIADEQERLIEEAKEELRRSKLEKEAIERERDALERRRLEEQERKRKREEQFNEIVEEVSVKAEVAPSIVKKVIIWYKTITEKGI